MRSTVLLSTLVFSLLAPLSVAAQLPTVVPGFPNVPQTPGALLSGLEAPQQGRTAILAYHNGILFTVPELPSSQPGSDFQVRTWDLANPANPVETAQLGISPMPINAHGYFKSGDYLVIGPNWPPEAPWSFQATSPGNVTRTEFPGLWAAGVRGNLFHPWYAGPTYWSYGEVGGNAELRFDGNLISSWDHLGLTGVVGHPFILGDLLIFASDQSRTGVATYDISDPANPVLLDVLTTGGPGGYWPEIWGGDGKLYIVFPYRTGGNGMRVVDASDPADLQFVADTPLPGDESMYIQFQDEYAFMGSHKVDMRTFESVLTFDGAGNNVNTSQFALPLGNLLVTGGIGPYQGMAVWAHQAAPDTRGPSVGYHIPQAGRTNYPTGVPISLLIHETLETPTIVNGVSFLVRPVGGSFLEGQLTFAFDDVLTFTPDLPLDANTTYEVILPAGGIKDAAGNGIEGYSFTFSTGSGLAGNAPPTVDSLTASLYPVAPAQNVTLSASATDPEAGPLDYRFDFGDGSPKTAWSSSTSSAHAYAERGHYKVTVQVRDNAGSIASDTLTVTVTDTPSGPFATRSTPVYCDDTARTVWTVNPDNDTVTALDADTLEVQFEVAVCDDPRSLARVAANQVWVACHDDDQIYILEGDGSFDTAIDTGYGSAPEGLAASPDGLTVYVALQGRGQLRRYDAPTQTQTGSLDLGSLADTVRPRAVAVTGDGSRILVSRFLSPTNHGEVWDVDASTFQLSRTLRLPKIGGEDHRDGTADGKGVPNYLSGLAISPDNTRAWVAGNKPNTERGLLFFDDLDSDNTVRNLLAGLDITSGQATSGQMVSVLDLDNSDSATAATYSPLGDYLFATLQGNDELIVLDALAIDGANGLGSLVTRLATGAAPQGLCFDSTTNRVFVKNFLGRSLSVLEVDELLQNGSKTVASSEVPTVGVETLSPEILGGKRLFYHASDPRMSAEGYLSCASCHRDGGHDGRNWDFTGRGEGLRNTTTLRGRAGTAQGNVHWSGNFDEIQDFEHDIRGPFGGTGFLSASDFAATNSPLGPVKAGLDPDLDALAAYVASLGQDTLPRSPFRTATGDLTAQAEQGRSVFRSLNCGQCHDGTSFTDSTQGSDPGDVRLHDVGTRRTTSGQRLGGPLPGIDTPTLLGLWNTAPYFHDGSAPTLEAVFRIAGGTVIPGETASVSGGASITVQWVELNNDDTAYDRSFAYLENDTGRLTYSGIDGGSQAGTGALEVRYSGDTRTLIVRVNGVDHTLDLPSTGNYPGWRHTHWNQARLEGVSWNAGATNTVELRSQAGWVNVSIDALVISTAGDLAAAQPHRQVLDLSAADRNALLAYLRQLDAQPEANPTLGLLSDDFESGSLSRWAVF